MTTTLAGSVALFRIGVLKHRKCHPGRDCSAFTVSETHSSKAVRLTAPQHVKCHRQMERVYMLRNALLPQGMTFTSLPKICVSFTSCLRILQFVVVFGMLCCCVRCSKSLMHTHQHMCLTGCEQMTHCHATLEITDCVVKIGPCLI